MNDGYEPSIAKEDLLKIYHNISCFNGKFAMMIRDVDFLQDGISYHFIKGTLVYIRCNLADAYTIDRDNYSNFNKAFYEIKIKALYNNKLSNYRIWTNDREIHSSFDAHLSCMKGLDFLQSTFRTNKATEYAKKELAILIDPKDKAQPIEIKTGNAISDTIEDMSVAFERKWARQYGHSHSKSTILKLTLLVFLFLISAIIPVLFIFTISLTLCFLVKYLQFNAEDPLFHKWMKIQKQLYKDTYELLKKRKVTQLANISDDEYYNIHLGMNRERSEDYESLGRW